MNRRMNGCSPNHDLCDISILLNRLRPFAVRDRPECLVSHVDDASPTPSTMETASVLAKSPGGIMLVIFVILASGMLGGVGGIYYVNRTSTPTQPVKFSPIRTNKNYHNGFIRVDNDESSVGNDDEDGCVIEMQDRQIT
uniref:Uncharacterized protein n=2 Tax=Cyclophora tenuis TaxID=216820 RepID=A0A7S1GL14_CYCTE|mmetsp:Transcript_20856/g.35577  ORF Transcript_20856/g.35577 Transcript_20856/m.35577 type:complete len:139 (+) Transcript_20856:139-555(+)